ncbi:MAG TPA: DUF2934 domain-containing protein [Lacunisphaera sp.]
MKPRRIQPDHFEPAEADVQKCAYFLWKEEGSPAGRDLDIWLRARELVRHHAVATRPRPGRIRTVTR